MNATGQLLNARVDANRMEPEGGVLIMKPMKLLLALSVIAVTQQAIAEDEYDYRAFPTQNKLLTYKTKITTA